MDRKMIQLSGKREKPVVGLEIEAGSLAAVELQGTGPETAKSAVATIPDEAFQDGEVIDAAAVAESLRSLFSEHKLSKRVRLGVANQRVMVRTLRLPAIDDPRELDAAVRFQAQEQIPMPLDQAVLDHRVVGGAPPEGDAAPKIDVILVAARREMIESSLRVLRTAGLQPIGIDLSAFGLIRALADTGPALPVNDDQGEPVPAANGGATLFCHVGDTTNLAVARKGSCLFTRVAPVGVGTIVTELTAQTDLSPDHARMWMNHVGLVAAAEAIQGEPEIVGATRTSLEAGVAALQGEMRLSLDFYSAQDGAQPIDRVVLSGPATAVPGFTDAVGAGFTVPFEVGRPQALNGLDDVGAARLTLPYGLALES
jgi:type IV pilus assembly protein PilM